MTFPAWLVVVCIVAAGLFLIAGVEEGGEE